MFLAKKFRLPGQNFKLLRNKSNRISAKLLTLVYNKQSGLNYFRLAVVSGKQVDKKAVNRNSVKRKIHNFFSREIENQKLRGFNLLVICKKEIVGKSQEEIDEELVNMINKL